MRLQGKCALVTGSDSGIGGGIAEAFAREGAGLQLEEVVSLARLGNPDDVAAMAVFLASNEAAYVTGSTYDVDGGMTNWNEGL